LPILPSQGGNHADEDSTATFNYALTSTAITLDDNTGSAYLIFAENNSVTIAGTIDGGSSGEGNLVVSGQTKTFSGNVGATNPLNFIVQASAVFNGSLDATNTTIEADFSAPSLVISGDITINANITTTGAQTYQGAVTVSVRMYAHHHR
jgi:cytoskeletal protein CcmA (bactofilin family)